MSHATLNQSQPEQLLSHCERKNNIGWASSQRVSTTSRKIVFSARDTGCAVCLTQATVSESSLVELNIGVACFRQIKFIHPFGVIRGKSLPPGHLTNKTVAHVVVLGFYGSHQPRRAPHGITLIGRLFEEGTVARAGIALERDFKVAAERPPGF